MTTPRVILAKGQARPLRAGHPLVFDGSVERIEGLPATGDEVDVLDHGGRVVGRGVFHATAPVRVRVLRPEAQPLDDGFLASRVLAAETLRREVLRLSERTDAYRLVHGAGDGLPGVAADRYGPWIVLSVSTRAMADRRAGLARALHGLPGVEGVWERPQPGFASTEEFHAGGGRLAGETPPDAVEVHEDGVRFAVDLRSGAKTGHFLDQRDNRAGLAALVAGRHVLDAFSGTGGFGLASLVNGDAASVTALDVSRKALDRLEENARSNGVADRMSVLCGDGFKGLRALAAEERRFGAVSVDPPRFAASKREAAGALRGYRELNVQALHLLEPGGLLASSSCTGVVSEADFLRVIRDAAADAGRRLQVLRVAGQAPDHPWLTAFPEGRYLKHVLARVF